MSKEWDALPPEIQDLVMSAIRVAEPIIRWRERQRIALWLEQQQKIARYAKDGVHPETGTRTQAAVLGWAVARILSDELEVTHDPAPDQDPA